MRGANEGGRLRKFRLWLACNGLVQRLLNVLLLLGASEEELRDELNKASLRGVQGGDEDGCPQIRACAQE